jgi:hypothetical protein
MMYGSKQVRSVSGTPEDEHGTAAVEFAVLLPIFMLLLFGVFQLGYLMNAWIVANDAARIGARSAAITCYNVSTPVDVCEGIGKTWAETYFRRLRPDLAPFVRAQVGEGIHRNATVRIAVKVQLFPFVSQAVSGLNTIYVANTVPIY